MHRNKSVNVHQFAMVPRADIPRSSFRRQWTHKTTFDAGYLIPILVDEVLPGDTLKTRGTIFARLATPLFPVMDNLHLDTFFFFVPCRLLWDNWKKFMGEQANPSDSISYVIPSMFAPVSGWAVGSVGDYMGLATVGQVTPGLAPSHISLPLRAYNLIWNEWFRDENLQNSVVVTKGDTGDVPGHFNLLRRGKRHDYFTSALPWPQKGGTSVSLPLGTSAPIKSNAGAVSFHRTGTFSQISGTGAGTAITANSNVIGTLDYGPAGTTVTGMYADLSAATAATINQIRQAFQIQKLLERDARGGTRYTEVVRAHFGVISPDARLQRPEYLGGSSTPVNINPIAQTGQTGLTGGATPMGTLAAMGTVLSKGNGFSQSFTEHGYIIGLASVRADLTYQSGGRKMWFRQTRYDFYFPAFAMLGEQAVLRKEIHWNGDSVTNDDVVFGYQERWAEYRYFPSMVTGLMRSSAAGTLDAWHLAQKFATAPTLDSTFIQDTPPVSRVVAVGAAANGQQFICDMFFDQIAARPLPMYSVPGMIDRF